MQHKGKRDRCRCIGWSQDGQRTIGVGDILWNTIKALPVILREDDDSDIVTLLYISDYSAHYGIFH